MMSHFLLLRSRSSLHLSFKCQIVIYLSVDLFYFVLLGVDEIFWMCNVFHQIQDVFSHFSRYSFCLFFSLLSFWGSCYVYIGHLMCSHRLLDSVHVSSFYLFLFLRLDNLNQPFKFADSFCQIRSTVPFESKGSIWFFLSDVSLFFLFWYH